jgi:hypothetical protein
MTPVLETTLEMSHHVTITLLDTPRYFRILQKYHMRCDGPEGP